MKKERGQTLDVKERAKEESWHDFCWRIEQRSAEAEPQNLSRISTHKLKLSFRRMSVNRK